jgi:membrane-bound lytic murein transglycosylase A
VAFSSFRLSCRKIISGTMNAARAQRSQELLARACGAALKIKHPLDDAAARQFFEKAFTPHQYYAIGERGLLTGYYEPEISGSRIKTPKFGVPVYRRPPDLVTLEGRTGYGNRFKGLTAARRAGNGLEPYATREQVDKGALAGRGLELLFVNDEVDFFFLQIQGSGRVVLPDGKRVRIGFDARNGHPYSSIGKIMIARGYVAKEDMSLNAVKTWLRTHPEQARPLMWENKSYIFFRELGKRESQAGPLGAMGLPLTPVRSLAVDTRYHVLGTPIYVVSPNLRHGGRNGFRKLMVAQDVGSAIKGVERGDIYWGSGRAAGKYAGQTLHKGHFYVLLPNGRENRYQASR